MLLHAQSAQLDGNRDGAQRAFRAMAERPDTRLLGLRGLFIEAQRANDAAAAIQPSTRTDARVMPRSAAVSATARTMKPIDRGDNAICVRRAFGVAPGMRR